MKKTSKILLILIIGIIIIIPCFLTVKYKSYNNYTFAVIGGAEVSVNNQQKLIDALNCISENHITKVVMLGNMVKHNTNQNYQILYNITQSYPNITFFYYKGSIESEDYFNCYDNYFTDYSNTLMPFNNYSFYFYNENSESDNKLLENINKKDNIFIFSEKPSTDYYANNIANNLDNLISDYNNVTIMFNENCLSPLSEKAFNKTTYASIRIGTINKTVTDYKTSSAASFGTFVRVGVKNNVVTNVNFTENYLYETREYNKNTVYSLTIPKVCFNDKSYERIEKNNNVYIKIKKPNNLSYINGYNIELYGKTALVNSINLASDYLIGDLSDYQEFPIYLYDYGDVLSLKIRIIDISGAISEDFILMPYEINEISY